MKARKSFLILVVIMGSLISLKVKAQTSYRTGFDNDDETNGWMQYRKGKETNLGWEIDDGGVSLSKRVLNISPTGDANTNPKIDWYVSPKFRFDNGGKIDSLSYMYWTFMGTHFPEESVEIYLLEGSQDPDLSTNILLCDLSDKYSGIKTWSDTNNILIPKSGEDCYIAFRFEAIAGWSEISFDNLKIVMNESASIIDSEKQSILLFPSPVIEVLNLKIRPSLIGSKYAIYGLDGRNVLGNNLFNTLNTKIDLSGLNSGLYFLSIRNSESTEVHKFYLE